MRTFPGMDKEKEDEQDLKSERITVGVLALQGAFNEHIQLLRQAAQILNTSSNISPPNPPLLHQQVWRFIEVRTAPELDQCDALIIPGGESTAISLVAQRSNLLEPLRDFVKTRQKPVWGTCAGLILLAESANRTKKGGQELIGGLDVRVNRNYFGRQIESFEAVLDLPFLREEWVSTPASSTTTTDSGNNTVTGTSLGSGAGTDEKRDVSVQPFKAIFIRAPIVERILPPSPTPHENDSVHEPHAHNALEDETQVIAAPPPHSPSGAALALPPRALVEILGRLTGRKSSAVTASAGADTGTGTADLGDIVAVRQGSVFGTSFHPELTGDPRIHAWWLRQVLLAVGAVRSIGRP